MDQRASRIKQIIEEAARASSRPRVIPLRRERGGAGSTRFHLARRVLLTGVLLALPALLPQHGRTAAGRPAPAAVQGTVLRGPAPGPWKFAAARSNSEVQVVKALLAGNDVPRGTAEPWADAGDGGAGDFPVY